MPNGIFTLKQQVLAIREGGWPGQKPLAVNYLVVAGGGGGAGNTPFGAGGGGGGGLLQGNFGVTAGSAITVTIGAGGSGGAASGGERGTTGNSSVFGAISASGGGGGGAQSAIQAGLSGGSGGGGGQSNGTGGQGTSGQGNAGGNGNTDNATYTSGAGGGGAGTVGLNGSSGAAGNGGAGVASDISGTRTTYAGGGGGASDTKPDGSGGSGGGGAGGGTAGTANTGGGGGGKDGSASGGSGGSGIVILSYPDIYAAAASTTGSPTVSTSGSGSLFFGGSTQYLTYSANSFSTSGNWTIEAWCYFTSSSNNDVVVNGLNSDRLYVIFAGTTFFVGDGITNNISVSNAKLLNQWFHLAVVKNGSTYTAYINGASIGSSTTALTSVTLTSWQVGGRPSVSYSTIGYISNLRIVTSAVYTGNFTVPTAPLTAISNTQLLLNSVSGAYVTDSSTNANAPTMTNSVTWNALSPFATGLGYKNRVYTWTSSGSITF
jgi:hypothetical protein